jgi:hypothetical protein
MFPWTQNNKLALTPLERVLDDLRKGYTVDIAAASADMLPNELEELRKQDAAFDRQCKIAENFGKRHGWDVVNSTSTGAVRAFQRRELHTWANSAEAKPERSIEDYIT